MTARTKNHDDASTFDGKVYGLMEQANALLHQDPQWLEVSRALYQVRRECRKMMLHRDRELTA